MSGILLLLVSLVTTLCTKEKLVDREPMGYVEIALKDWMPADENDGGRIYFYPTGGTAPICMDCEYSDREMQHIFRGTLPAGEYYVITMNRNFTNAKLLYDDTYEDARISVVGAAEAVALTKAEGSLIGEPASVFLTHEIDDARFPDNILVVGDQDKIRTQTSPKSMVKRVSFTITLEEFSADACSGVFAGVSPSVKCSTCQCLPTTARANLVITPSETAPRNVFTASLNVFDVVAPGANTHTLDLTMMVEGKETKASIDLSGEVAAKLAAMENGFSYDEPLTLEVSLSRSIDGEIYADVEEWGNGGSGEGFGGYDPEPEQD